MGSAAENLRPADRSCVGAWCTHYPVADTGEIGRDLSEFAVVPKAQHLVTDEDLAERRLQRPIGRRSRPLFSQASSRPDQPATAARTQASSRSATISSS